MYIHKVKKDRLTEMSPKLDNDDLVCFSISSFYVQHFPEFSLTCFYTSKEKHCSSLNIFLLTVTVIKTETLFYSGMECMFYLMSVVSV